MVTHLERALRSLRTMLAAAFLLGVTVAPVGAQRAPALRFAAPSGLRVPLSPAVPAIAFLPRLQDGLAASDSSGERGNVFTVAFDGMVAGSMGLVAGAAAGFVVVGGGLLCRGEDCGFIVLGSGAAIGEVLGIGAGSYIGGAKRGSLALDLLAAAAAAALPFAVNVPRPAIWYVVPATQIVSTLLADRAAAASRPR